MTKPKLSYHECEPDQRLKEYIKSYWFFTIRPKTVIPIEILPDGYFDLLIVIRENKILRTSLTGIWEKPITINYSEDTDIIGVRFTPLSLGILVRRTVRELLNTAEAVELQEFSISAQQVLDNFEKYPEDITKHFDAVFLNAIDLDRTDNRVKKCFDMVNRSAGTLPIEKIADEVGLSARQLRRISDKMMGLGLKDYSKIVRFKKSLKDLKIDKSAYNFYYDQSHFIREIKQYAGQSPTKLGLGKNDRFIQYFDFD